MARNPLVRRLPDRAQTESIPSVRMNVGQGKGLIQVGQMFATLAELAMDRHLQEEAVRGKEEGAKAALTQQLTLPDGTVIPQYLKRDEGTKPFVDAFNRQQLITYGSLMETSLRTKTLEVATQFRDDPEGMAKAYNSYLEGVAQSAPVTLQAEIRKQGAVLIQPQIFAAYNRRFERGVKAGEDALNGLESALGSSMHAYGVIIGQDKSPDGNARGAALQQAGAGMSSFITKIANLVDGKKLTAEGAVSRLELFRSKMTRQLLEGMFDGTDQKEAMYAKLLKGDSTMDLPLPTMGGVRFIKLMPGQAMNDKDISGLKTFMGQRLDEVHQLSERRRIANERVGEEAVKKALREFSKTGAMSHYNFIFNSPWATAEQIDQARTMARERPHQSDAAYYSQARDLIQLGRITSERELDWQRLSQGDREDLVKRIELVQDAGHFTKQPHYRLAEDSLAKAITGRISQMITDRVVSRSSGGRTREQAAVALQLALRNKANEVVEAGGIVGRNNTSTIETFERVDAEGKKETVTRFDPFKWVQDRFRAIDEQTKNANDELVRLRGLSNTARMKAQALAAAGQRFTPAYAEALKSQSDAAKAYREMRDKVRDAFITNITDVEDVR